MANITMNELPPLPLYTLEPQPHLIPGFPDEYLTLALPIAAYWIVSLFFHLIDAFDLFPQYRLHTPAEVLKRNHVTRWEVFRDVVLQQIIQTIFGLGLAYFEPTVMQGKEQYDIAVWAQRIRIVQRFIPNTLGLLGIDAQGLAKNVHVQHPMLSGALAGGVYPSLMQQVSLHGEFQTRPGFASWELLAAKAIYHVIIPALQFLFAIFVVDTWQYFLHRAMHMNKWLYTTFHSRHHRLYVPYAYGALYNHPVEGFMLDTLGTGIAYLVSGMTCRQSMWFFTMSTIKTVDDHCGYSFPWDPLQHITSNNAGYHDVHHQSWGIKTNFSQPFFTFWDGVLGTKWSGGDVSARYERAKIVAQKKMDADAATLTNTTDSERQHVSDSYADDAAKVSSRDQAEAKPEGTNKKAKAQAAASRQQVFQDRKYGGSNVVAEETFEEVHALKQTARPRKDLAKSANLKGLADRLGDSLRGTKSGVLGMESRRR